MTRSASRERGRRAARDDAWLDRVRIGEAGALAGDGPPDAEGADTGAASRAAAARDSSSETFEVERATDGVRRGLTSVVAAGLELQAEGVAWDAGIDTLRTRLEARLAGEASARPGLFRAGGRALDLAAPDDWPALLAELAPARARPSECLARVHERLLEFEVDPAAGRLVSTRGARKRRGSWLTSERLARASARRALDGLAAGDFAANTRGARDSASSAFEAPDAARLAHDFPAICDPSCGAGAFLLAALIALCERYPRHAPSELATRCLYGVDRDPLAVELARYQLWRACADPRLPQNAFDENVRVGDALIGADPRWLAHYPRQASGGAGRTVRRATRGRGTSDERGIDQALGGVAGTAEGRLAERPSNERAVTAPPEGRAALRDLADQWCALWFWPAHSAASRPDEADWRARAISVLGSSDAERPIDSDHANEAEGENGAIGSEPAGVSSRSTGSTEGPTAPPATRPLDSAERIAAVATIRERLRFFHWPLEFPEVFERPAPGFDLVIGNPPWEIAKPNSREWFERHDPGYRGLDKRTALARQRELFERDPRLEDEWRAHLAEYEARARWLRGVGPFEEERLAGAPPIERAQRRAGSLGFRSQGRADTNAYKLFLERCFRLCRTGGRVSLHVPSGVYSDRGTRELRRLLLDEADWEWLFGFDNSRGLFDIHRSYKFCALQLRKRAPSAQRAAESRESTRGAAPGPGATLRVAFGRASVEDWERAEEVAARVAPAALARFSPDSLAIPELADARELALFERLHAAGPRLSEFPAPGEGPRYRREYDMTSDARLFRPRAMLEAAGARADAFGRRIEGDGEEGERVWLPLFQGVMMQQYRGASKAWVSGGGAHATWVPIDEFDDPPGAQFFVAQGEHEARTRRFDPACSGRGKLVVRDVARATDERSAIATWLPDLPCANALAVLHVEPRLQLALLACLNSFVLDWALRRRLVGVHLNRFVLEELPLPDRAALDALPSLRDAAGGLALGGWLAKAGDRSPAGWPGAERLDELRFDPALAPRGAAGRRRVRALVEAAVALCYGLDERAYEELLFAGGDDDPRGFWRVDRELPEKERAPRLAFSAFRALAAQSSPAARDAAIARELRAVRATEREATRSLERTRSRP